MRKYRFIELFVIIMSCSLSSVQNNAGHHQDSNDINAQIYQTHLCMCRSSGGPLISSIDFDVTVPLCDGMIRLSHAWCGIMLSHTPYIYHTRPDVRAKWFHTRQSLVYRNTKISLTDNGRTEGASNHIKVTSHKISNVRLNFIPWLKT